MSASSLFAHAPAYPGDPILSLNEDFQRDPRADKVNLSIGLCFDEAGRLPVMHAVSEVERRLQGPHGEGPRPYLPMAGLGALREAIGRCVFGADSPLRAEGRIATLQTLGGSGALKVGADLLRRLFPEAGVWISDPSWENHRVVFEGAGFAVHTYPYHDARSGGLRFEEMLAALSRLPARSIVLLHACCHNPTGVDLSSAQWQQLIPVLREREAIAFVDMAYQGFGEGLEPDAQAVRTLAESGVACLVANSFSKNFSLYGERCGGLSVVCATREEAARLQGQLEATVRANYSNPPTHGARVIATVLDDAELAADWSRELGELRQRIERMRHALHARLSGRIGSPLLDRYLQQRGMFTYTGLTPPQVERLRQEFGIYLLRSGRMCVAGLNARNVDAVGEAIAQVLA
ncbi:MAG: aromatic-amino-acid transaminase [Pseudomonadota bacterium]|nr:aromatic-amino-acid transaminase [Pseudomonadota bacterium]